MFVAISFGRVWYTMRTFTTTARPMATKCGNLVTYYKKMQPIKYHNPLNTRSHDKLKTFYLYHHNAYGYQTWQSGYIQLGASFHKVTCPFYHVV